MVGNLVGIIVRVRVRMTEDHKIRFDVKTDFGSGSGGPYSSHF
jgi:hypothetical protein